MRRKYRIGCKQNGFSLLELMIAVAIVGIIGSLAISTYTDYTRTANVARAITEIRSIELMIKDYWLGNRSNPPSLSDVGINFQDPWGNDYEYLDITGGGIKTRKDKNLVPINTDYDLYSNGPDGKSALPLTAKFSKDDIVRANNGKFVGPADAY